MNYIPFLFRIKSILIRSTQAAFLTLGELLPDYHRPPHLQSPQQQCLELHLKDSTTTKKINQSALCSERAHLAWSEAKQREGQDTPHLPRSARCPLMHMKSDASRVSLKMKKKSTASNRWKCRLTATQAQSSTHTATLILSHRFLRSVIDVINSVAAKREHARHEWGPSKVPTVLGTKHTENHAAIHHTQLVFFLFFFLTDPKPL